MNILKRYIRYFNDDYVKKIEDNKELLIKSFIKYYGAEHEEKIRSVFAKSNYFWYVGDYNSEIRKNISMKILNNSLDKMNKIAEMLGYSFLKNNIKCKLGNINIEDNKISIESGSIVTTGDNKIDMILESLFGEDKIYKENNESLFNNFFKYSISERESIIKSIFGPDANYDEYLDKIIKIREFLEENYPYEVEQINYNLYFYIFDEYMKTKKDNNKVIGSLTNQNIPDFEKNKTTEIVSSIINDKEISCPFSVNLSEDMPVVAFNVLLTSDLNFIHEINHSIKASILAYNITDESVIPIKKSGICVYGDEPYNADILEEILNDIEASAVEHIFHELGGNIFDEDILKHHYMNSNSYPKFYPLVIRFYTLYKDLIKDASITDDANILYKRVNKEKMMEYIKYIDYVYKNYFDKEINAELIDQANKLIDDMSLDLKDEMKLDDYIKELEKDGIRVHKLN